MIYSLRSNGATLSPRLLLNWSQDYTARSLVHDVLGSGSPDVTLRASQTRSGYMTFLCYDRDQATALEDLHSGAAVTLLEDDAPVMTYVVNGAVRLTYVHSPGAWTVDVDYREVDS